MKKKNLIFTALFALSVLAVLAFSGCSEPDPEYTIMYEITGPESPALIWYRNEELKQVNITDTIPWSKTIIVTGKDIFLKCETTPYYSNNDKKYTVNIYVNGSLKATDTASHLPSTSYTIK